MRTHFFAVIALSISVSTCLAQSPSCPLGTPNSATELLVVVTPDWNAVSGALQRYERADAHKTWRAVGHPVTVVVGKTGLGWGSGVLPTDEPGIRKPSDPVKKEGDGKAPAGVFCLSGTFGYSSQKYPGWKMAYTSLTPSVECVDDIRSKYYNRVVDRESVSPDWNSSEHMLRNDELYRWGIEVDHNSDPPVAGAGSCIFMHIWRGPGQGTVGCTAMPVDQLATILGWLDPARVPMLAQMPLAEYKRLEQHWKLPKLTNEAKRALH
jgi:D-alanyl-D-alanine dipeptidase